ncbi:MAG TPA: hypothetical protein VKD69_09215 [Vicinamibacterales bacterium]|nr:hypothetical protein [Vicinamibacterales bacterium]
MPDRPLSNDLFELFPDLPWVRQRSAEEQVAQVRRQVAETRARAGRNIERQRLAAARVRAALSARRRR